MKTMFVVEIIGIIFLVMIGNSIPFIGFIFYCIAIGLVIGFLVGLGEYNKYSNYNFEDWRIALSKTWKYQSNTQRAMTILKLIGSASKL